MAGPEVGAPSAGQQQPRLAVSDGEHREEPSAEEAARDADQAFGEIFAVQPPRDILAGLWSGMQCVLSGVIIGLAGAVATPIQGARESGTEGCLKGAAAGLFSALFFSLTGLCTGMFQAVRGAVATPKAICMVRKGWRWNSSTGDWVEPESYSLPAEAERVLGAGSGEEDEEEDSGAAASASRSRSGVADTYYYDQLGVQPSASQRDIRQAYFHQSKRWHPDKSTEATAKERFQAISEAYQVLSDPERRRAYDIKGRQGAGEGFIDARVFFSVLLGADALEPYIGRLKLAEMFGDTLFGASSNSGETGGAQQQQRVQPSADKQLRRQVRLAVSLAERLDSRNSAANEAVGSGGSSGSADGRFHREALEEARSLVKKDPSVKRFLLEIGWVYQNRAESFLAGLESQLGAFGMRALRLRLRRRGRETSQQATTAKLAVQSYLELRKIVKEADEMAKEGAEAEAELPSSISHALPTFMEIFWSITTHDITSTLDKVLERVLGDASVDDAARLQRAEALQELGAAFVEATKVAEGAASAGPGASDATSSSVGANEHEMSRKRFEEAFIASVGSGTNPTS